jgi:hypothetical protein
MAIELSSLTFTNQADIVPPSGVEPILNTGIANSLAGNDIITGTWTIISDFYISKPGYIIGGISGFYNMGTLNTADGNDIITGIIQNQDLAGYFSAALYNEDTIDTGDGNDVITGSHNENVETPFENGYGLYNIGTIDTGNGNDTVTGITNLGGGLANYSSNSIITGNGNDRITGIGTTGIAVSDGGQIDTGNDNDIITGTGIAGLQNTYATITTGNGNDIITGAGTSDRGILNLSFVTKTILRIRGVISTGDGNDIITGISTDNNGIDNSVGFSIIDTGEGNDVITGIGRIGIYNEGTINTGNGEDSIITDGGFDGTGSVFLGNGKDYLKGFGKGNFNGGNDKDTLELTSGSYTVGISGTAVNFTKGNSVMNTSDFEILIAGNTIYNFASLTNGQTISIA